MFEKLIGQFFNSKSELFLKKTLKKLSSVAKYYWYLIDGETEANQ